MQFNSWRIFCGLSSLPSPADDSPLIPVHRGKGPLSNTTHIRFIVQTCFDHAIQHLTKHKQTEETEALMMQPFIGYGIPGFLKMLRFDHVSMSEMTPVIVPVPLLINTSILSLKNAINQRKRSSSRHLIKT